MVQAFSPCLRWRVVWAITCDGYTAEQLANTPLRVSCSTARRIMACFEEHDDVFPPGDNRARPCGSQTMTLADDWTLIKLLVDSPESMLKELFADFCRQTGCLMHRSTFCRAVKRVGFSRKKVLVPALPPEPSTCTSATCACPSQLKMFAQKRDEQASRRFLAFVLGELEVDQLFFLDETAADERSLRRCFPPPPHPSHPPTHPPPSPPPRRATSHARLAQWMGVGATRS